MQGSLNGMKFIACREAFVRVAYPDGEHPDGSPKFSLGFGSQDPPPKSGDTTTIEAAFPRLRENIEARAVILNRKLTVELPQHVFDALLSLYYQSGTRALEVADSFNAGQPELAIAAFVGFRTNQKGEFKPGLLRRRFKEIALADSGNYGDISRYKSWDGNPKIVPFQWAAFPENL